MKIFDRENEFHAKNLSKVWDRQQFIDKLGGVNNLFTINSDSYGWLINLINYVNLNRLVLSTIFTLVLFFSLDIIKDFRELRLILRILKQLTSLAVY